jgi:16S rRNA (adenine(1408)-N(1))-methyltransferase
MDVGAGDGRFVLSRASEHPEELVLAVDASHDAMREASWRAGRSVRRGGQPNALFVASSLEALPPALDGIASLVTVHFPWGTLLRAALGQDAEGASQLARLLAPGGHLRLLVSAAAGDAARGAVEIDVTALAAAYRRNGLEWLGCRPATNADVTEARSSWGRRLLERCGDRRTMMIELHRP